jgi:hypothetical protein
MRISLLLACRASLYTRVQCVGHIERSVCEQPIRQTKVGTGGQGNMIGVRVRSYAYMRCESAN